MYQYITHQYGADGLRNKKDYGLVVYNYYYSDGLLMRQTWGSNYIDFLYDESGTPYSFIYNDTQYYYIKNLQGDVIAIANTSGSIVVNYTYDAWGNILSVSGSMASTVGAANPIRYRSYYYDTDTGFYYLQSRYYDPAIRRFINADGYINANGDILGFNMYAYCGNNPVMGYDPTGKQNEWLNELESRWNHVKTFGWRLITSPLKALTVKVGRGEGLGVNIKAKASAIDISVSAESHQSISMVYDKGTLGVEYVNETSIGVELNGININIQ